MKFNVEIEVPHFRQGWKRYIVTVASLNKWKAIEKVQREFPKSRVLKCERAEGK